MRIQKECSCCGAEYTVAFTPVQSSQAETDEEEILEDAETDYPEFCPFCGAHEGDEVEFEEEDDDE